MKQKNKNTLYCFSPAVMLVTIAIELAMAGYVFIRLKHSTIKSLIFITLLLLAIFQLAEYNVCGGLGQSGQFWSRTGYVAITFLPAIGIHGISLVAGKRNLVAIVVSYALATTFALFFAISPESVNSTICAGNYVIFKLHDTAEIMYYVYYNAMLLTGIGLAIGWRKSIKNKAKKAALLWYVIGYLTFMVPTGILMIVNPSSIDSLPSIMCGFAVIFAIILAVKIAPLVASKK